MFLLVYLKVEVLLPWATVMSPASAPILLMSWGGPTDLRGVCFLPENTTGVKLLRRIL